MQDISLLSIIVFNYKEGIRSHASAHVPCSVEYVLRMSSRTEVASERES